MKERLKNQINEARKCANCVYIAVAETVANDIARIINGLCDVLEENK